MSGKTARNMQSTDNNKEYYITLHLVGCAWEQITYSLLNKLWTLFCRDYTVYFWAVHEVYFNLQRQTYSFHCARQWISIHFFGAIPKLRKGSVNFVMSVCSFVCLAVYMEQLGFHSMDFHEIWHLITFRKNVEKIQNSLKSGKNNVCYTWRPTYVCDNISGTCSYNEKYSRWSVKGKSEHISCSIFFFPKIVAFIR